MTAPLARHRISQPTDRYRLWLTAGLALALAAWISPTLAQGSSKWTGDLTVTLAVAGVSQLQAEVSLDLMLGEVGSSSEDPSLTVERSVTGMADVVFIDPTGSGRRYAMSAPAIGHLGAADGAQSWSLKVQTRLDIRTSGPEAAAFWAEAGPNWGPTALADLTLEGQVSEPDAATGAPTAVDGTGTFNLADFGCLIPLVFQVEQKDLPKVPGRCARRVDHQLVWQAKAEQPCAVSPAPPEEIARLFQTMLPAVNHPRCQNCHGAYDVFTEATVHPGGDMRKFVEEEDLFSGEIVRTEVAFDQGPVSVDCHGAAKGEWRQARTGTVQWAGQSPKAVCDAWMLAAGPGSSVDFMHHMAEDVRIQQAFEGFRGLSELVYFEIEQGPLPPPMSHAAFVGRAETWAKAAGIGLPGAAACACAALP